MILYYNWTTKFVKKCVYHKTVLMFFYVFWGADFENNIENFVVSMVLPLFKVISNQIFIILAVLRRSV